MNYNRKISSWCVTISIIFPIDSEETLAAAAASEEAAKEDIQKKAHNFDGMERMANLHNLRVICNVPYDGDCFFHSVATCAQFNQVSDMDHLVLRSKLVEYLKSPVSHVHKIMRNCKHNFMSIRFLHILTLILQIVQQMSQDEIYFFITVILLALFLQGVDTNLKEWITGDFLKELSTPYKEVEDTRAVEAVVAFLKHEIHILSYNPDDPDNHQEALKVYKPKHTKLAAGTKQAQPLFIGHIVNQHFVPLAGMSY